MNAAFNPWTTFLTVLRYIAYGKFAFFLFVVKFYKRFVFEKGYTTSVEWH